MKRAMIVLAILAAGFCVLAQDKGAETRRKVLVDPSDGGAFNHGTVPSDKSLVAKHLGKDETFRNYFCGGWGGYAPLVGVASTINWVRYNYLVFDVYNEGSKPWKGYMLLGEGGNAQGPGGFGNYAKINVEFKPGENKEYKVKLEGLKGQKGPDLKNLGDPGPDAKPIKLGSMGWGIIFRCEGESASMPLYFGKFYIVKIEGSEEKK
jgi:hypothetical protein